MRVMVLVKATEDSEKGFLPTTEAMEAMEAMGFRVTHLYGLTESYGPATLCAWQDAWNELSLTERAQIGGQNHVAALCELMAVVAPVRADVLPQVLVAAVDGAHLVLAPPEAVLVLREHCGTG